MGSIKKHQPVKLVIGFIFKEKTLFDKARNILAKEFGKIDYESGILDFTHTDYYAAEFGRNLKRKFVSFQRLIPPEKLAQIKIKTNTVEKRLSNNKLRRVNIDPGYLDMAKLVLASAKNYRQRLYLGKGIYAEIALSYQDKTFTPWEWTYPDYKSRGYIAIFNRIREIYAEQIKNN